MDVESNEKTLKGSNLGAREKRVTRESRRKPHG